MGVLGKPLGLSPVGMAQGKGKKWVLSSRGGGSRVRVFLSSGQRLTGHLVTLNLREMNLLQAIRLFQSQLS